MGEHNQNETLTRRPTLLALLIGGLVLAGGIALIVVATGGMNNGKSGNERAAAMVKSQAQKSSASASSAAPSTPATSSAPSSSSAPTSSAAASPASVATRTSKPKSAKPAASAKPITYTVKRGDNLTVIARWFHMHGYGSLYDANKSVIGHDPNLIFAGQKITVSAKGMTVGR